MVKPRGKGARVLIQTNTCGLGYNSFFCYTKRASVGGRSDLCVVSCKLLSKYKSENAQFKTVQTYAWNLCSKRNAQVYE